MEIGRRPLIGGAFALAALGSAASAQSEVADRYGMIGKMKAKPGQRAALIAAVGAGSESMPGCLLYVISEDAADPDGIWIAEFWDSKKSHDASLSLPAVQAAIVKARPLIAGFEPGAVLRPVSGLPLPR